MTRCKRRLLLTLALTLAAPVAARGQGPVYVAQPPSKGALYTDGQSGRYLLGGSWLYRADRSDIGLGQRWWRGAPATNGWFAVRTPNAYNAGDLSPASMQGYVGWYRKDFTLPSDAFAPYVPGGARRWIVRFESVNYRAQVWLNGRLLGSHEGAYLPFELDLKGLRRGVNRLVVRVDNRRVFTDLPPGPSGLWWNYGGLLREVYLRSVQRVDLARVQVRPLLRCRTCAAKIDAQVVLRNPTGAAQTVRLNGFYGRIPVDFGTTTLAPHASSTASTLAWVRHPRLWSIDHPALYRTRLALSDAGGRPLGGYVTDSGIRRITVSAAGRLELNWRALNLRGVDLHEQDLSVGAALGSAQLSRLVGWIRTLGASVIRAHYPLNPEIEQMADHDGILIWSEVPVYQITKPAFRQPRWLARAKATLRENILTNQNHPSVLLWSIGNELPTPATAGEARYIAAATATAHRLDPTRPVGMAISSWPGVPCQPAYAPLDLIGYNDYFGWFDAGGGGTDDRDALGPFLDSLRACYPNKALMISEFGFEGDHHGPVEERGSYEFQSNSTAYHLGVFASKPWLSGAVYWLLRDFAAKPGWSGGDPHPHPPFVHKGLVDLQGNLKPAFDLVAGSYRATRQIAPRSAQR